MIKSIQRCISFIKGILFMILVLGAFVGYSTACSESYAAMMHRLHWAKKNN